MKTEIERMTDHAEAVLVAASRREVYEDPETAVSDLIANLAIFAHERDLPVAELVTRGLAHYAATYIEPLDDDDAYDWLHEELFPFTGERQFPEYVAEGAIVLSGKAGRVEAPEWGV